MNKILIILFGVLLLMVPANSQVKVQPETYKSSSKMIYKSFQWQGRKRSYWLHLPPETSNNKPLPLLFHLHGGGGTGKGTVKLTYGRFNQLADREGFIVIYPNAVTRNWNDGRNEVIKEKNGDVDDVGFIAEIINQITKVYSIDKHQIFTTGMSNGGFMSSRLLCDRADLFRGAAILTASLSKEYLPKCKPEKPVAVLVINGTEDPLVPYAGGDIKLFKRGRSRGKIISNDDFLQFWQDKNGCNGKKSTLELPNKKKWDGTSVTITTYNDCQTGGALKFFKINGGGHTWPGGRQYLGKRIIGNTSYEINACDEIWNFFCTLDERK